MSDETMPLDEAVSSYSSHPTLTPESEKYLSRKWARLRIEIDSLRAELTAVRTEFITYTQNANRQQDEYEALISGLKKELEAAKRVMENTLKVQSEVFEWRQAWKEKAEAAIKALTEAHGIAKDAAKHNKELHAKNITLVAEVDRLSGLESAEAKNALVRCNAEIVDLTAEVERYKAVLQASPAEKS